MTNMLISALIEKNAFAVDTIITAKYDSRDLFGRIFSKKSNFKIKRILNKHELPVLELGAIDDVAVTVTVDAGSIIAIDGMDLDRYADIYDLQFDGSSKKIGKKRGRKPKSQLAA